MTMTIGELKLAIKDMPDELGVLIEYDIRYKGDVKSALIRNNYLIISEESEAGIKAADAARKVKK